MFCNHFFKRQRPSISVVRDFGAIHRLSTAKFIRSKNAHFCNSARITLIDCYGLFVIESIFATVFFFGRSYKYQIILGSTTNLIGSIILLFKTDMFTDHHNGVVNVLAYIINNIMTDRHNCKKQEIKTPGRDFRSFQNFRSAIYYLIEVLTFFIKIKVRPFSQSISAC